MMPSARMAKDTSRAPPRRAYTRNEEKAVVMEGKYFMVREYMSHLLAETINVGISMVTVKAMPTCRQLKTAGSCAARNGRTQDLRLQRIIQHRSVDRERMKLTYCVCVW